jgi:GxxExxY protein
MLAKAKTKSEGAEKAERTENSLTDQIIGAAIEVHRHLGPGLLESAYEECLCYELSRRGISFQRQVAIPLSYKGLKLDCAYRLDLIVEGAVIVELKAIENLDPIHASQLLTYLKTLNKRVGLLINFNVPVLKNGLKRIVNNYFGPPPASVTSAPSVDSSVTPRKNEMTEAPLVQSDSAFSSAPRCLHVEDSAASSVTSAPSATSSVTPSRNDEMAEAPSIQSSSAFFSAPPCLRVEDSAATNAAHSAVPCSNAS